MQHDNSVSFEGTRSVAYAQRTAGNALEILDDDMVVSAYVRLLEREQKKREEELAKVDLQGGGDGFDSASLGGREDHFDNIQILCEPMVPLDVLARMRLAYDLYEWRNQMKSNPVLDFAGSFSYERNSKEEVAAMLRYKQQCAELQKHLNETRHDDPYREGGVQSKCGIATMPPGMPFADFERDIVEPFFDALFPPIVPQKWPQNFDKFSMMPRHMFGSEGSRPRSGYHSLQRVPYQRWNPTHVEAVENFFHTVDTNEDGLVSWDELSAYILDCGQRQLAKDVDVMRRKSRKTSRVLFDVERENGVEYVGRMLNLTTVPANTTLWQKRYPLVRFLYHTEAISHIVFIDHGRRYVTAAWDGLVKLWRTDPRLANSQGKPAIVHERNLLSAGVPVLDMVTSPRSLGNVEMLVVLTIDCSITLLRPGTGEVLKTFRGRHSMSALPTELRESTPVPPGRLDVALPDDSMELWYSRGEILDQDDDPTTVMRPEFKVRAYHREALSILFTDVSKYFTGLGIVAPTYEHLEKPLPVKTDILSEFGVCGASSLGNGPFPDLTCDRVRRKEKGVNLAPGMGPDTDSAGETVGQVFGGVEGERGGRNHKVEGCATDGADEGILWFSRSVALTNYEKLSSTSILPSGPLMLIGFNSGVLQFFPLRSHWFDVFGQMETRLEPSESYHPLLTLKLHRAAIVKIVVSKESDTVMTVSDDCTVGVRHLSRIEVPFMTLGECVPLPGVMKSASCASGCLWSFQNHGHKKRITCVTFHAKRALLVTGSLDRTVIFWVPSSPRPLHRLELSRFRNSATSGFPVDVSFMQPSLRPLLLMAVDSKRVLYFFDVSTYQCVYVIADNSPGSLRYGEMLCARYDAVDDRLILGGYYPRVWNPKRTDDYPVGYLGHRLPVVGLVYQKRWDLWFSADEEVIIVWRPTITETKEGTGKEDAVNPFSAEVLGDSKPQLGRSVAVDMGTDWRVSTIVERSWVVEGGICCISVEQTDSAHVFVALERRRRIEEYNGLNSSLVRVFAFPAAVSELSSLASGAMVCKGTLRQSVSLLCASFEKERSLDGTTALYLLPGKSGEPLTSFGEVVIESHRHIITDHVGVSAAIIYEPLGIVIIGHRGGISTTPVDDVTKCPIPCTRLADTKLHKYKGKKSIRESALGCMKRRRMSERRRGSQSQCSSGTNVLQSGSDTSDLEVCGKPSTRASSRRGSKAHTTTDFRDFQSAPTLHGSSKASPPLDLVALIPGPLFPDPVAYTREFMLNRERYLNCDETEQHGSLSGSGNHNGEGRTDVLVDGEGGGVSSKPNNATKLLLFSRDNDEFLPPSKRNSGFLLSEQFANLGFVGHIVPVGGTGYLVTGSDDGLIQVWNGRSRAEVFRFRVTYDLDSITAMEVSRDGAYIAIADYRGHMALLDVSDVHWLSPTLMELEGGAHEGVLLLQRWRAHRNNITSLRFIQKSSSCGIGISDVELASFAPESNWEVSKGEGQSTRTNEFDTTAPFVERPATVFVCASGDDGYVYVWSVRVPSLQYGSPSECTTACIGYFGSCSELAPKVPSLKHNPCAFEALDVIRRNYVAKRLLPCLREWIDSQQMEAAVQKGVAIVKDDMQGVRYRYETLNAPCASLSFGAAIRGHVGAKVLSDISSRASFIRADRTAKSDLNQDSGTVPLSYAFAFREEFYGDCSLSELLTRLLSEVLAQEAKISVPPVPVQKEAPIPSRRSVFSRRGTRDVSDASRDPFGVTVLLDIPLTCGVKDESTSLSDAGSGGQQVAEGTGFSSPGLKPGSTTNSGVRGGATPSAVLSRVPSMHTTEDKEKKVLDSSLSPTARRQISSAAERSARDTGANVATSSPNCNLSRTSVGMTVPLAVADMWLPEPEIVVKGTTCAPLPRRRYSPRADAHRRRQRKAGTACVGSAFESAFTSPVVLSADAIVGRVEPEKRRGVTTLLEGGRCSPVRSGALSLPDRASPCSHASTELSCVRVFSSRYVVDGAPTIRTKKPKRKAVQDERVRAMKTLMGWNVCRASTVTGSKGTVSTAHSPFCKPICEGSLLSYPESSLASLTLPALIPPVMNDIRSVGTPSDKCSGKVKSLITVLEEEKEVMKAVLAAALQEKEQLLLGGNPNVLKLPALNKPQNMSGGRL